MKDLLRIFMALALLAWPVLGAAEEGSEVEGDVYVGGWDVSDSDAQEVVNEYKTTDGGLEVDLDLSKNGEGGGFLLESWFVDSDEQSHTFDWEVGRMVRSHTTFDKFIHRLTHDSLEHLQAATPHGRTVKRTETDPDGIYGITYSEIDSRTEFQFPGFNAMTFGVVYHSQEREGVRQLTTVAHCESCHVTGQGRQVQQETEDIGLDLAFDWDAGQLKLAYTSRELTNGVSSGYLLYDNALHPEQQTPVFDNRLQYEQDEGIQAVDMDPDTTKDTTKVTLDMPDLGGLALNAGGIFSNTENDYTGAGSDYAGYLVNLAKAFGKGWDVRWRGRYYSIDNDDVFVEVNERPGTAGPHAGKTYTDVYPIETDFIRESTLNRDVVESKLDFGYRISKKAGSLRFGWEYESVDRENVYVAPNSTKSTTQVLQAKWTARPRKGTRYSIEYEHGTVDDPYLSQNTAYSTFTAVGTGNPFSSPQYYEFHEARIADPTAVPESWDALQLRGSWRIGDQSLSAMYKWWDGDNGAGDLTDWSKTNQIATVSWWLPSSETLQWNLAYTWNQQETNFPITVPVYDG